MATLVLSAAGAALGGAVGGSVAGLGAAALGRAAGAVVGGLLDQRLLGDGAAAVETGRVDRFRVMGAREGAAIPRVYGRMRVPGHVVWASRFHERVDETTRGGKGAPRAATRTRRYSVSLAIALCEGPIDAIGRVWADGRALAAETVEMRLHRGDEAQAPDPLIAALEGEDAPAYRGTAYLVIEDLALAPFGDRVPQFHVEVHRQPRPDPSVSDQIAPPLSELLRGVALSPGTGEFALATVPVRRVLAPGRSVAENVNSPSGRPDLLTALDQLEAAAPGLRSVSLIVCWFGDDLRCGRCAVYPAVETAEKATEPLTWSVSGLSREAARVVGRTPEDRPVYGGTPSDQTVIQAIRAIRARGWKVTLYPFLLMDIPPSSGLPDPYGRAEQPAYPWRGRITLGAAPGQPGSADRTPAAAAEVEAFFGTACAADFAVEGETARYDGPAEWTLRRFVLHCAALCAAAGGVDAFLIGTELRGLTSIRDSGSTYPAVRALKALAAEARALLGPGTAISYAADWSEFGRHAPEDGGGDLFFHLDPLWSDPNVDFVGIDNYLPLADWRPGTEHADFDAEAGPTTPYDLRYLRGNVEGGELHDWYYASEEDRAAQARAPITDGFYGEPWVWRAKDLRNWWAEPHRDRPGGLRASLAPQGGAPRLWPGLGAARVEASDAAPCGPFAAPAAISDGRARFGAALSLDAGPHRVAVWTARGSARIARLWIFHSAGTVVVDHDFDLWATSVDLREAHEIRALEARETGGGVVEFVLEIGFDAADPTVYFDFGVPGGGSVIAYGAEVLAAGRSTTGWVPRSKPIVFTEIGCPAVDLGANQPNVFLDPKSSESAAPRFSNGAPDPEMQRRYLQAALGHWADPANNPVSPVYGGPMIDMDAAHVWTWDARPWPDFPQRRDVWADGANHRLGHWITGRLGAAGLAETVAEIAAAAGVERVDVDRLHGVVDGYWLDGVQTGRQALQPLMLGFGFGAAESGDRLRFAPTDAAPAANLGADDLLEPAEGRAGGLERAREPAGEAPEAIRLDYLAGDAAYEPASAEARGASEGARGVETVALPAALDAAAAQAIVERWRAESAAARESAAGALPPSRLALEPGDVIAAGTPLGTRRFRLDRVTDGLGRRFEARGVAAPAPARAAPERARPPAPAPVATPPAAALLDLPAALGGLMLAAFAAPWPGPLAVWRSADGEGWVETALIERPAVMGELLAPPASAAPHRWDRGAGIALRLWGGSLAPASRRATLDGANLAALETQAGDWEVVQFSGAEMTGPESWRLTGLLRGQAGTEALIAAPRGAGARFVLLDGAPVALESPASAIGLDRRWRIGAARLGHADPACVELVHAPRGAAFRPFAPARLRAWREGGDLLLGWRPRDPADADGWGGAGEPAQAAGAGWRLRVVKDGATLRVATPDGPSYRYDAATQAADGAAPPFEIAVAETRPEYGPGPETRIAIDA